MHLLLCAATPFEIQPTLDVLAHSGGYEGVQVLITGVGLVAATYSLTRAVYAQRPDIIVQAGIGGALRPDAVLGNVVAVRSETIGDEGVQEGCRFATLFELGFVEADASPYQNRRLTNPYAYLHQTGLARVDGITVNQITTDPDQAAYYSDQLGAAVESMEGAALHYVGLQENIPFLQLRSFSNYVGERNKKAWKLQEAITALNRQLIILLPQLLTT